MEPVGDPNCKWSPDAEDACSYCNGEDCRLCSWSWEALRVCEHAIDERHMDPPRLTNVRQSDERLTRRKARKLARERGSYERAADIRAAGLTGFIARRSTRRGGGWWATLRPYAGSSPARSPLYVAGEVDERLGVGRVSESPGLGQSDRALVRRG